MNLNALKHVVHLMSTGRISDAKDALKEIVEALEEESRKSQDLHKQREPYILP